MSIDFNDPGWKRAEQWVARVAEDAAAQGWETHPNSGICAACEMPSDWADSCSHGCVLPPAEGRA